MVEDFVVCVDGITAPLPPSSSERAAECFDFAFSVNDNREKEMLLSTDDDAAEKNNNGVKNGENADEFVSSLKSGSGHDGGGGEWSLNAKSGFVRECRICQEEDGEQDMESPCACNGTLKFAHRKCIQKWCNKKGNITCEICNQAFSPDYNLPQAKSNPDAMAIDIRQAWGSNIDLHDPHFLAFAAAQHQYLQPDYEDYAIASSGTLAYFRMVVFAVMLLMLIRQVLMITRDLGIVQESSTFFCFQILLLQLAVFLLPCYLMARSWYILQCRSRRQV